MKSHFNIVLDTRDDGTRVWSAKCLRCDAVLVGESAPPIPIVEFTRPYPPVTLEAARKQLHTLWERSRKTGAPLVLPYDTVEIVTMPDHGLQRALDAHCEACEPR